MYNGGRDDNTSTKLTHSNNERTVHADRRKSLCEDGYVHANGTGDQNHEKEADANRDIVVVVRC